MNTPDLQPLPMPSSDELALLDLLPAAADGEPDGWQQQGVTLEPAIAAALGVAAGQGAAHGAALLVAALAWTQSRLTGEPSPCAVVLRVDGRGELVRCHVDVDAAGTAPGALAARIGRASGHGDGATGDAVAWAVEYDPAPAAATSAEKHNAGSPDAACLAGCASVWRLILGATPRIDIRFRRPLGAQAIGVLIDGVQRAVGALAAGGALSRSGDEADVTSSKITNSAVTAADIRPLDIRLADGGVLDIVDADDRDRQLRHWNATSATPAGAATVHGRFAAALAAAPDAVAVVDGSTSLTYAGLDASSRMLARRLRATGVVPGAIVGVAMPRSVAAVAAVLAVLRAGAAYLPLDTAFPPERLAFMLDDAGAQVVLVDAASDVALPASVHRIVVDAGVLSSGQAEADPAAGRDRDTDAATDADGEALAYVMYTSGSTGVPKGVEIPHRAILRLVCGVDFIGLDADTRMLHAAPLGFDASTLELWGPLLNGGCVVVHDEAIPTGAGLASTIAAHGVTTAWLTAALFNAVVDDDPRQLAGLRELFTGGEALSVDHVRRMRHAVPDTALHNGYGPTECTTFTCTHPIPADIDPATRSIPIGRPIADTRLYVLNRRLQPVPLGVAGELYVGGAGLARGYLRRPELTAQRFVADPFGPPGWRLYQTGDLVRYRDDGVVEFLGRADTQVKIRGFRIELSEIEQALARHEGVLACAVLARADRQGGKRLVAYWVADRAADGAANDAATAAQLRAHLARTLPEFMVPTRYLQLPVLPVTTNGKLDRNALPEPDDSRPELACAYEPAMGDVERVICAAWARELGIDRVGRHDNFFELGGNSLQAVHVLERVRAALLGLPAGLGPAAAALAGLTPVALFRHPTPAAMAASMAPAADTFAPGRMAARPASRAVPNAAADAADDRDPIAIVGMAARLPGAADVEAFWTNLCHGVDSITRFAPDQLDPGVRTADRDDPAYVRARGVIDGVELFDPAFFGISPKEAELMDPQQRIFLELCWECLERAGHVPDATPGPVGVYAGMYNATYFQRHVAAHPDLVDKLGAFQVMLGNEKDYIATRVAHRLNLTGPAISVHTGCSTSLVAICQAMDALRAGQCDMALAGGVAVTCPPRSGYLYQEGSMLSPDGQTRSFDADARGTVFSDGAAVVLLKRLADARRDGNPVIALIRGGAVNNDGGHKASFTAPSSDGQAAVIAMAQDDARVDPRDIGYIEAHGTATPLGDPIEIEGLTRAFRRGTGDIGFCRIGSLKSNIGHTVIAAGAAGVIKTALMLRERALPASIHFERLNPSIDFAGSPFVVNEALRDWPSDGAPRLAGVSSFGVGGTNAHVVMQEAPPVPASDAAQGPQLLVLSARTPAALAQAAANLASHLEAQLESQLEAPLEAQPQANLADVAWTLAVGRKAFAHRLAVVADSVDAAVAQLRSPATATAAERSRPARGSEVVFLFPGQGAVYAGMGRELYRDEPAFREAFDACADALLGELGFDLRERVFSDDPQALLPTAVMQPATFAIEYALARLWMARGVQPAAMIGHSVGEFVAATLAGVFALPDALRLVARRGALMQAMPAGAMLSVRMPLDALLARLPPELSLAAENAPGTCVVAGALDAVAAFQARLEADAVACRALRTSHAFHSTMMEPVLAPFLAEVAGVARGTPQLPLVSTATGQWLDAEAAMSAEYWARHLREPVRFASALGCALQRLGGEGAAPVLLEVGPRATLVTLARQHPLMQERQVATVATLSDSPASEVADARLALGQLWSRGVAVDPARFDHRGHRQRVRLPTYPFERRRCWLEMTPAVAPVPSAPPALPAATPTTATASAVQAPPEPVMSQLAPSPLPAVPVADTTDRKPRLVAQLREVIEDVAGFDLADADPSANFMELGLDSLMLTQVALQLQKTFSTGVTFRQLMGEAGSLARLAAMLDAQMPADVAPAAEVAAVASPAPSSSATVTGGAGLPIPATVFPSAAASPAVPAGDWMQTLIAQQMQLMAQQLALLSAGGAPIAAPATASMAPAMPSPAASMAPAMPSPVPSMTPPMPATPGPASAPAAAVAAPAAVAPAPTSAPAPDEDAALAHTTYDVAKAFGAIARIHSTQTELTGRQRARLDAFERRYIARTRISKEYTQQHRAHLADPRVVNGFRPLLKEITYQIVVERSKGSRVWDLDGNEYIDVLNGFGMNLFGWQPDFVVDAVKRQIDQGYEIGPQHPLAGEVAKLVCDVTGFDRAGLCNTGSEAVMGTIRIARTVTGRNTLVIFTGSYHGIFDEVIVRGTRKLRSVPAAPGILRNTAENVLVLDYGTPESLQIIRERAGEIAAVLVEPVQSRRPDFQPREFLHELRAITRDAGALLIFDEVVTGFRAHPRGAQAVLGVDADLASYGKVVGGGFPIGVIAGKREYMDALDGGQWQFGDASIPTVGVTYFAGTFVRHPLALAAARAVLEHIQDEGPGLQERLNAATAAMAGELNAFCAEVGAPIQVKHFASVWKTFFDEDHPLQDLLFAMVRSRGIHILDNFPCFFTTAHTAADFAAIVQAFKESVLELQEAEFLPRRRDAAKLVFDASQPPMPGARLGRDADGNPAWFVANPDTPDKYMKVSA